MSNILLVEDEAHLAQGLRFNLEAEGHSVDVVGTGEEALQRLMSAERQVDVAVLDVMLPGIDGFAVVRELRKARRLLPVLVLTALNRPEDVLQGFASGADDYLPKPFDLKILLARVSSLLRRRAWQSEQAAASQAEVLQTEALPTAGPDATFEFSDIIVDFHAEATSEKVAMAWHLDGRVTAVFGTHTHVQTADERILPKGTACLTDAGMTGPHDSIIGVTVDAALARFLNGMPSKFEAATGPGRFNAVIVTADPGTGKATAIERLNLSAEQVDAL